MAARPAGGTLGIMTENAPFNDQTYPPVAGTPATQYSPRLFRRSRTDRMLGGVCGGLAESLGVDAALLRIGLVAATLLGFGAGAVIYIVCWLVVPEADPAT
jgi:phage shock protein PspC (stress-responsive transcriptional regulator)